MQRIAIVGTTGSGKTTLGERLAERLGYPLIDLDAIHWGPDWTPAPRDEFRERIAAALSEPAWITAGNYNKARDIVWGRADTLIWLDYPLGVSLLRLFRRTVGRIVTREELWAGNRETWRGQFASRDSLFVWAVRSHKRHRVQWTSDLTQPEYAHLEVLRFRRPSETEAWLRELE
jgi:adenylate kinase family enzyme